MAVGKTLKHFEFLHNYPQIESNTFYIYGEDIYFKDQVAEKLILHYLDSSAKEFDFHLLYGEDTKSGEIIEFLRQSPFLNKYKIVLLRDFEKLNKSDKDKIASYSLKPVKSSILIVESDVLENRKPYTEFKKNSVIIQCKKPYNSKDIFMWLKTELKKNKIEMDFEAEQLFVNYVELDYYIAKSELDKLIIYSNNRKRITKEDVLFVTGKSRSNNVFDLQNAIGIKDLKKTFMVLENLVNNRENAIMIITMLSRFFLLLRKINALRKANYSDNQISESYLKSVFWSFRKDYLNFASKYNSQELKKVTRYLFEADSQLKSSDISERIILEILIYKIVKVNKYEEH